MHSIVTSLFPRASAAQKRSLHELGFVAVRSSSTDNGTEDGMEVIMVLVESIKAYPESDVPPDEKITKARAPIETCRGAPRAVFPLMIWRPQRQCPPALAAAQPVVVELNLYKTSVYYDIDKKATIEIGPAITRNNGCIILFYLTSLSCPKINSSTTETGLWKDHVRQNQLSDHVRQNYMSQSNVRKNCMSQSNFFLSQSNVRQN